MNPSESNNAEEILRLRERCHDLSSSISGLKMRLGILERWQVEHDKDAEQAFKQLKELMDNDRTAKAIAVALKQRNKVELTTIQRVAGVAIFILTIASSYRTFFGG